MKKSLTIGMMAFILSLCSLASSAQNIFNQDWITSGGTPNGIYDFQASHVMGNDQGIVVVGNTFHAGQAENFLISRYRNDGTLVFKKEYDGTASSTDFATDVTTIGKSIYVTGVEGDTSTGVSYITTLKLDSLGNIIWTTKYQNAYGKYNLGFRIIPDPTGANLYVCGTSQTGITDFALTLLKYKEIGGSPTWVASYDSVGLYDAGIDLKCNTSQVIVYGISGLSSTSGDIIVRAYNASTGGLQSQSRINNTGIYVTRPVAIAKDNADNIYLAGVSNDIAKMDDIVIVKLDSLLNPKWRKYIDGGNSKNDAVTGIKVDSYNNLVLSGFAGNSDGSKAIWTIKMRDSVIIWNNKRQSEVTGKDAIGYDVDLDTKNNIYVTGKTYTGIKSEIIVLAFDTSGNKRWEDTYSFNAASNDEGRNIKIDSGGNILVYGRSKKDGSYTYVTMKYIQDQTYIPSDSLPKPQWAYYENKGQLVDTGFHQVNSIRYYSNTSNPRILIGDSTFSYFFNHSDSLSDTLKRIDLVFYTSKSGSAVNKKPKFYATEKTKAYLNYYIGGLPQFYEGIRGLQRITAKSLYSGIDLQFYSDAGGSKYYYIVQPGASPSNIVFGYQGATNIVYDSTSITIVNGRDSIKSMVKAYQGGTRVSLTINSLGSGQYGFIIGSYNTSLPLTITVGQQQPQTGARTSDNLNWSTYFGSDDIDYYTDISADDFGEYAVGNTESQRLPSGNGTTVMQNPQGYLLVSYLNRFDINNVLSYTTYFGGSVSYTGSQTNTMYSRAVAAGRWTDDPYQPVYISGATSIINMPFPSHPRFPGGLHDSVYHGGDFDGFIARFNGPVGILEQSSYVGGDSIDIINTAVIDVSRNNPNTVYFGGEQTSTNFPFQNTFSGNFYTNSGRGFIMQLDTAMVPVWTTAFGSNNKSGARHATVSDMKLDRNGDLLVTGSSINLTSNGTSVYAITQPTGSYTQLHLAGPDGYDAFVAKFQPLNGGVDNKYKLYYWTDFGGSSDCYGQKICTNSSNDIYIAGTTAGTTSFPLLHPLQTNVSFTHQKSQLHTYVARFSSSGQQLFTTLYGGNSPNDMLENVGDITCDGYNNLFVFGAIPNEIPSSFYLQQKAGWYFDSTMGKKCYLAEFNPSNQITWSTLFGGLDPQTTGGMAKSGTRLYISGSTKSHQNSSNPVNNYPLRDDGVGTFYGIDNDDSFYPDAAESFIAYLNIYDTVNTTGIIEQSISPQGNIKCYPNPSNGTFTVDFQDFGEGEKTIYLYNSIGQLIFNTSSDGSQKQITESLSAGFYVLEVRKGDRAESLKLIILDR